MSRTALPSTSSLRKCAIAFPGGEGDDRVVDRSAEQDREAVNRAAGLDGQESVEGVEAVAVAVVEGVEAGVQAQ